MYADDIALIVECPSGLQKVKDDISIYLLAVLIK
jgi:hypothetical protein